MVGFAINHMSVPRLSWEELLNTAGNLGCVGVEFRNDLDTPLFAGATPDQVAAAVRLKGLRVVGLSQVYPFNAFTDAIRDEVAALITMAKACGAETISLIPRNDGTGGADGERQDNLRLALREIRPLLEQSDMVALVEPLGFERSSLRSKAETIEAIEAVGGAAQYKIVHDTFHHFIAGETEFFPEWTGIIHVSGVVDPSLAASEMEDEHRVLVDRHDRLGNVEQIAALRAGGYTGAVSMEAFSPETHALTDPEGALDASFEFMRTALAAHAA